MKGILFTALLVFGTAASAAGIIATLANQGGGEIVLTDASCPNNSSGAVTISTDKDGHVLLLGCATILPPDRFFISWDSGQASLLKSSDFTLVGTPTREQGRTAPGGRVAKFKNR